jgi:pimeloyl-ACP methyl ester carboxylesterase
MTTNGSERYWCARSWRRLIAIVFAVAVFTVVGGGPGSRAADATPAKALAASAEFQPVGARRSFAGLPPWVHEWSYELQRGPSPFDRIALHRYSHGAHPPQHPGIVMLYLPGTNMNGEVSVIDLHHSLPLFMANHGVDFWALDYRTHFIPRATPVADLSELKGWTNELFESDIAAAADFVMRTTGRSQIFVAAFSRGVSFAYLFAARHPHQVEGLVIFDGSIGIGHANAMPPSRYADDIGGAHLTYDKRKALMEAVIANPDGPAPLPKYKTARENLEQVVYGACGLFGGHGGLANPAGGYSDAVVLARMLINYDRYWPTVQDYENPFTPADLKQLASSKIPVIAFTSTNIGAPWPAHVARSAASTGSNDVTVKTLQGWGHLDVICGTHAEAQVFTPALLFLRRPHRK